MDTVKTITFADNLAEEKKKDPTLAKELEAERKKFEKKLPFLKSKWMACDNARRKYKLQSHSHISNTPYKGNYRRFLKKRNFEKKSARLTKILVEFW